MGFGTFTVRRTARIITETITMKTITMIAHPVSFLYTKNSETSGEGHHALHLPIQANFLYSSGNSQQVMSSPSCGQCSKHETLLSHSPTDNNKGHPWRNQPEWKQKSGHEGRHVHVHPEMPAIAMTFFHTHANCDANWKTKPVMTKWDLA